MKLLCVFLIAMLAHGTPGYDTELTSANVEWIYTASERGTHLAAYKEQVLDMVMQLPIERNHDFPLNDCGHRKGGTTWTPYLSTIRKLVDMGEALGYLTVKGTDPNKRVRLTEYAYELAGRRERMRLLTD